MDSAFNSAYNRYVSEHGDLYKKLSVPMDEEDRKKVRNFFITAWGFLAVCTGGFFAMLYWKWPETNEDIFYAALAPVLILAASVWCYTKRKKTLKNNVKTSFTGIITFKREKKNSYSFRLSGQDYAQVTSIDFGNYSLGDIVSVELIDGPGFPIAYPKTKYLGNIYGQSPAGGSPGEKNSFWRTAGREFGKAMRERLP
ncbi:MAG TPA: hypothetical protein VG737_06855 [Cyclobacteriaceae bacterium]|nr:hypothetical protein [Cyclobacteriaceae bacterium]